MSHVHDAGEWCARCVEHGVTEEVRRNQRLGPAEDPIYDRAWELHVLACRPYGDPARAPFGVPEDMPPHAWVVSPDVMQALTEGAPPPWPMPNPKSTGPGAEKRLYGWLVTVHDGSPPDTMKLVEVRPAETIAWVDEMHVWKRGGAQPSIESARELGFRREDAAAALEVMERTSAPLGIFYVAMDLARFRRIPLPQATRALIAAWQGSMRDIRRLGFLVPPDDDPVGFVADQCHGQAEAYTGTMYGKLDVWEARGGRVPAVWTAMLERVFGPRS